MSIQDNNYRIVRHDYSGDKSLRAWSAADEYLLEAFGAAEKTANNLVLYNDRFGYLSCYLHDHTPTTVLTHKSQEKAIEANFNNNNLALPSFSNPLSSFENKMDCVLMKVPKSLGLFQLFLEQIVHNSTENVTVTCAFMTRHFSPKLLQIAEQYFDVVEQSRAVKKARLLVLSKKKDPVEREIICALEYKDQVYEQYLGVFSADHIDYATQFFLEHIELADTDQRVLDLASGNGIIGNELFKELPDAEIHLLDDAYLAVRSAELNVQGANIHHHHNNELAAFESDSLDLIVTNPPFHFEYEVNINIPIKLFKECLRCLKKGGSLQMVASQHLNYKTHLEPLFSDVQVLAEDKKFVVYKCTK